MEKSRAFLGLKLLAVVCLSLWFVVVAMMYSEAEVGDYWAYLTLAFLYVLSSGAWLFSSSRWQGWLFVVAVFCWGGLFVLEEYLPSIKREFVKMSCADIDLVYDEVKGECVAR